MKRLIALAMISAGLITAQAGPHFYGGYHGGGHYYHGGIGPGLGIGLGVGLLAGGLIYHDWVHRPAYYSTYPVYTYPSYQPVYQYQSTYAAPAQTEAAPQPQPAPAQQQAAATPVNPPSSLAAANSLFGR